MMKKMNLIIIALLIFVTIISVCAIELRCKGSRKTPIGRYIFVRKVYLPVHF